MNSTDNVPGAGRYVRVHSTAPAAASSAALVAAASPCLPHEQRSHEHSVHCSSPLLHVLPVPVLLPLPSPLSVPEGGPPRRPLPRPPQAIQCVHALCKKTSLAGMLGGTKPGPGSDLEVQDNDESTDDLNSYWLLLQTKLNLSESMNAVDLVYCPVFNTSSGGHFASVFLLPAISKAIHMDSLATCGLYELATQVLSPFFAFCLNAEASVIPLLRKDHTAGIDMQQSGSNVCINYVVNSLTTHPSMQSRSAAEDAHPHGQDCRRCGRWRQLVLALFLVWPSSSPAPPIAPRPPLVAPR